MKTKEAIEFVNSLRKNKGLKYLISTETYLKHDKDIKNNVLNDVINLLKRGEAFEKMWEEIGEYEYPSDVDFDRIEEKYFKEV